MRVFLFEGISIMKSLSLNRVLLLILIIAVTTSLPLLSHLSRDITIFPSLPEVVNHQILYQFGTLVVTGILLLTLSRVLGPQFRTYFARGNSNAPVEAVPILGIKPKDGEGWNKVGRDFAIVISAVTCLIMYFQVFHNQERDLGAVLKFIPFILIISISNSFVEEMISRLGLIVVLKEWLSDRQITISSALLFGIVHYWGNPGGIPGVLAAAFLGWLLAKSILETKGIFWAWLIHFLQDFIIFTALFLGAFAGHYN